MFNSFFLSSGCFKRFELKVFLYLLVSSVFSLSGNRASGNLYSQPDLKPDCTSEVELLFLGESLDRVTRPLSLPLGNEELQSLEHLSSQSLARAGGVNDSARSGLERIRIREGSEKDRYLLVAPATSIPSASEGRPRVEVEESIYEVTHLSADALARAAVGAGQTTELVVLGRGGMQVVYADPTNAKRVIKVYDREMLWGNLRRDLLKRIDQARQADADQRAQALKRQLQYFEESIRPGDSIPELVDRIIAVMIQRQKVLGRILKQEIAPLLSKKLRKKVSLARGLEHPDKNGVTLAERVRFGSKRRNNSKDFGRKWSAALQPFNKRLIGANEAMGASVTRGSTAVSLDIGNQGDELANVFLKFGKNNRVTEVKIIDY